MNLEQYFGQPREGTGLNRVFPYAEEPVFPSANPRFPTALHNYKPITDEIYRLIGLTADPGIPGGRLTLTSGTAVTTSDVTGATTLYYATYLHTFINLWDTTLKTWFCYPFTPNLALAVGTTTTTRPHDVFAYVATKTITGASNATPISITCVGHGYSTGDFILISGVEGNYAANGYRKVTSTGTDTFTITDLDGNSIAGNGTYTTGGTAYKVTLEHLVWTSATARATALTTQNGAYMKSGDLTRRYLGSFYTTSTTATEDSKKSRLVINQYNRVQRKLRAYDDTNSWTSTTNAFESWNGGTTLGTGRVDALFPSPNGEDLVDLDFRANAAHSAGAYFSLGIGLDSTTVNSATPLVGSQSTNLINVISAKYLNQPGLGYHYFQMLQRPAASGTTTFYGDGNTNYLFSAMEGYVWG